MTKRLFLAAVVLAGTAVPALAEDAPAPARTSVCLRHSDVDGWGSRDKKSMVVNDRFGRKYLVSLAGLCSDLNWAFGAGFRGIGGNIPGSCVDRGDRLIMRGGGVSQVANDACWVTKVQPYTKDMEQADKVARANKQPLAEY
ncbi:hypothetical protein FHS83_003737 [Rhizomicrobium palustre]|uniref:Uncharacterized protein n=1 Tax=Rhizomicrobium palustre TaxID=189966 RepID=A0A846N4H6_9PROT|nr:DUF6491 family protein [Rhizomicrobium palustre]NIK90419.1 hypothetical protein [Rhizomicrobium palustre]